MMWLTLALMALTTFAFRYAFFTGALRMDIGPRLQRFLGFSAPCVLVAMAAPIVLVADGELAVTWTNPYLLGGVVAIGLSLLTRQMLAVVVISLLVFAFAHRWLAP